MDRRFLRAGSAAGTHSCETARPGRAGSSSIVCGPSIPRSTSSTTSSWSSITPTSLARSNSKHAGPTRSRSSSSRGRMRRSRCRARLFRIRSIAGPMAKASCRVRCHRWRSAPVCRSQGLSPCRRWPVWLLACTSWARRRFYLDDAWRPATPAQSRGPASGSGNCKQAESIRRGSVLDRYLHERLRFCGRLSRRLADVAVFLQGGARVRPGTCGANGVWRFFRACDAGGLRASSAQSPTQLSERCRTPDSSPWEARPMRPWLAGLAMFIPTIASGQW